MVKNWLVAICGFVLIGAALARDPGQSSTIKVHLNYTGTGTVDEKHQIYVVLWDSADFVSGEMMPVSLKPASTKDGVVTFSDVKKVPAFVSAAFDPSGQWDGESGPPPEGTSLGLYSDTPGKPKAIDIAPGKTVTVELGFDDSVKMKAGGPTRQAQ